MKIVFKSWFMFGKKFALDEQRVPFGLEDKIYSINFDDDDDEKCLEVCEMNEKKNKIESATMVEAGVKETL